LNVVDVDCKFLDLIDVLVHELFDPEKVVVKLINGNAVTGEDLINFTLTYCEVFKSGKMPKVGTILEVYKKAVRAVFFYKVENKFQQKQNFLVIRSRNDNRISLVHSQSEKRTGSCTHFKFFFVSRR